MKTRILTILFLALMLALCLASCGETPAEPPHTHTWSEWSVTTLPTCETEGVLTRSCDCGLKGTSSIPANGHNESEWIVDKEPTETKEGSKHIECTVCSTVLRTETIPALIPDHTHQ